MLEIKKLLAGWGNFPKQHCRVERPEHYSNLTFEKTTIARGQGRSYGDAALNAEGLVLLTERLNRFIQFDKEQGTITAEAGLKLAELLAIIVPAGWFLPVTPGTQDASLGGCVAADVHGKNHHHRGSFCQYVREIELVTASQQRIVCSEQKNAAYFQATIGGMGLTGFISKVTLQLVPIATAYISAKHYTTADLEQTFQLLSEPEYDDEYVVAWLDGLATGKSLGRGIVITGRHADQTQLTRQQAHAPLQLTKPFCLNVPFSCPSWLLNKNTIRAFNAIYFQRQKTNRYITGYQAFFYPLDTINNWNRLYGKQGFIQYQFVLPSAQAFEGIKLILQTLSARGCTIALAVLKRFGNTRGGYLSFPMPGYTLSLDIPIKNQALFTTLNELDAIVINHQGKIYLAKDSRLNASNFRSMYKNYAAWLAQKKILDPNFIFNSSLARRLKLGAD